MKLLKRLDQQKVYREPHGSAPVGVPAEQPGGRVRRLIIHPMLHPIHMEQVGMVLVEARQGANSVRRQEFLLIQHVLEDPAQLPAVDE